VDIIFSSAAADASAADEDLNNSSSLRNRSRSRSPPPFAPPADWVAGRKIPAGVQAPAMFAWSRLNQPIDYSQELPAPPAAAVNSKQILTCILILVMGGGFIVFLVLNRT
jgi:hypothetical protein